MVQQNPLSDLRETIRNHWHEYRPQMCAAMEAEHCLDEAIEQAARNTEDAVHALISQGRNLWDAWIEVRGEWAILPAEAEEDNVVTNYPDIFLGLVENQADEVEWESESTAPGDGLG